MGGNDFHLEPFDEGTIVKLNLFQNFLREWLFVFVARNEIFWKNINVLDLFSGPGLDKNGIHGSPLIILEEIKNRINDIRERKLNVNIIFNDIVEWKFLELTRNVELYRSEILPCNIQIDNRNFLEVFNDCYADLIDKKTANLIFLDQTGIKHVTPEVFSKLIKCKQTDILFFVSSSFLNRFHGHEDFKKYINIPIDELKQKPFSEIHEVVLNYYKSLIPESVDYYLAPFSIKKDSNIFGIIFGSSHYFGLEKFLNACWHIDPAKGEANFDIDDENIIDGQMDVFTQEPEKPTKIMLFEQGLEKGILDKNIIDNRDIYIYTLEQGFLPKHANEVFRKLIKSGKVEKMNLLLKNGLTTGKQTPLTIKLL